MCFAVQFIILGFFFGFTCLFLLLIYLLVPFFVLFLFRYLIKRILALTFCSIDHFGFLRFTCLRVK